MRAGYHDCKQIRVDGGRHPRKDPREVTARLAAGYRRDWSDPNPDGRAVQSGCWTGGFWGHRRRVL